MQRGSKVVITSGGPDEAFAALEKILQQAHFWDILEDRCRQLNTGKEAFRILIKPDMEYYDFRSVTGVDPQLVENLIDLLHDRGYTQVLVASGPDPAGLWLENREIVILADLAGYRYVTAAGRPYDIIDLGEPPLDRRAFPGGSILYEEGLSTQWQESHFCINFAKNKTEEECYYGLGLYNLLGILPLRAGRFHYRSRLKLHEVAAELYRHTRVDFTIIDAWMSNHGSQGSRFQNPLDTQTFIAGDDLLLVDWAAALKMGQDPYASPLNATLLREAGLPVPYQIEGDLTPYAGWKNVSKIVRESTLRRNRQPAVDQLSKAWLQHVNTELFPFRNTIDGQLNQWLRPLSADADQHPLAYWALIGLNYFLANLQNLQEAWQILYDKDRLYRQERPIGIDLKKFKEADFENIAHYIRPLAQVARQTAPDANGLRWRYLDGSVLFEYSKVIQTPYEIFIQKVDIASAVQLMYDNIGGAVQVVKRDRRKRAVHQAERDIYLPQPNWIVLFGGDYIDVGKIEKIHYGEQQQEILWRTVNSANGSAEFDDGMVAFSKDPGGTLVTIVARQKFKLPLFWQVLDIDYLPDIKKTLVSDAYVRFFSRTIANYEALCEERDPRIGKSRPKDYGENSAQSHPLALEQFRDAWSMLTGMVDNLSGNAGQKGEIGQDEYGYRHFKGSDAGKPETDRFRRFAYDLGKAIQKDIQLLINLPKKDRP